MALSALALALAVVAAAATAAQPPRAGPPSFELQDYNPVASSGAVILAGNARFTVLTDSVIRMEYASGGKFEDRPTLAVLNRNLPVPKFTNTSAGGILTITTEAVKLSYTLGKPFEAATLSAESVVAPPTSAFKWSFGAYDHSNLLGTIKSLDQLGPETLNCTLNANKTVHDESLHCEWGMVSRSGWAVLDDGINWALTEGAEWWDSVNTDSVDQYLFGHGLRFKDAIADYVKISGSVPLLPRYALGVWWTRWYDLNERDVRKLVSDYESRSIPLDVFVLDMDWHKKDNWGGFTFDEHLFKNPLHTLGWLQRKGLHTAANLHDANGVGNYDSQFEALCKYMGLDPTKITSVPFSMVNKTYVYGLEDIVLGDLYKKGLQFWWIDWQQGGKQGGCQGGKQNPTIWTNKIRVTDMKRQGKNERGLVLARWGGLGTHRYNVGFTGDVAGLSWTNLAYQPYFSLTAANVAYGWISHDIVGPWGDHEMYVRWVQWASYSGVLRSHDRGMSAGGCYDTNPRSCPTVRIWEVPAKYFEVMRASMVTRDELLPYTYTVARRSFDTGLGMMRPMYYEYPEFDMAYAANATGEFGQYFFGDDMFVHPIVVPAASAQMAETQVWLPPGQWFVKDLGSFVTGAADGSTVYSTVYDLSEVPVFIRPGAVIPSIPVKTGATLGLAAAQYAMLEFTIYPGMTGGHGSVYEDDAHTRDYLKGAYAWTNVTYARTASEMLVTISASTGFPELPATRGYRVRLINSLPPTSVSVNGKGVPYNADGGPNTWHFCGDEMAVVVETAANPTSAPTSVSIGTHSDASASLEGLKGAVRHAILAKRNLDEVRGTPGSHKATGGMLMDAAEVGEDLAYLAGTDFITFQSVVAGFWTTYEAAIKEVAGLGPVAANKLELLFGEADNDHVLCGNPKCLQENSGYKTLGTEGYMPAVGQPNTKPLYLYWNGVETNQKDNWVTTDGTAPKGYVPADFSGDGTIFSSQEAGTRPLYLYFNAAKVDHLTVSSPDSIKYAEANGYSRISTLGYVLTSAPPAQEASVSSVNPERLAYSAALLASAKKAA